MIPDHDNRDSPEFVITISAPTPRHKEETIVINRYGAAVMVGETVREAAERHFKNIVEINPNRRVTMLQTIRQYVPSHGINHFED